MANDKNESDVLCQQMKHLGREKGNAMHGHFPEIPHWSSKGCSWRVHVQRLLCKSSILWSSSLETGTRTMSTMNMEQVRLYRLPKPEASRLMA